MPVELYVHLVPLTLNLLLAMFSKGMVQITKEIMLQNTVNKNIYSQYPGHREA